MDGVDREYERIHLSDNHDGVPFDLRTKKYVPVSVPLDIEPVGLGFTNADLLAALVDPETEMKKPNIFSGIHACDGLALQQNMETVHLNFKTVSIDEKPSEYLTPLIQLHGDEAMDRICQGSGRGLTDFSEDKHDRGENARDLGTYKEGADAYASSWINPRSAERRIIPGTAFTESATWTRTTTSTAE